MCEVQNLRPYGDRSGSRNICHVCPSASALDRYVPGGYNTIQAAIKASGNGDTVYVNPGTYTECITIDGKYVSLRAVNGDPNATLLTGCAGRSIIMVQNVPYREGVPRVTISGFRIANGSSPEGQGVVSPFLTMLILSLRTITLSVTMQA